MIAVDGVEGKWIIRGENATEVDFHTAPTVRGCGNLLNYCKDCMKLSRSLSKSFSASLFF